MRINIEIEYNEKELGKDWMNIYNLKLLLFSSEYTRIDLLKINKYEEITNGTIKD